MIEHAVMHTGQVNGKAVSFTPLRVTLLRAPTFRETCGVSGSIKAGVDWLEKRGLVELLDGGSSYRITDAGRATLATMQRTDRVSHKNPEPDSPQRGLFDE